MPKLNAQRRGAIIPLFAVLFPVLVILTAISINLAYMQLTDTEMQIAVDVAAHAGGRRLGTPVLNEDGTVQTLAETKEDVMKFATEIAAMNDVGGSPAAITSSAMDFGRSAREVREDGTLAGYKFTPTTGNQIPSSFRIQSDDLTLPHAFAAVGDSKNFTINSTSVSTQVDRDVVLVLDRSGSMIYFEDEALLEETLDYLREEPTGETVDEFRVIYSPSNSNGWFYSSHGPYMTQAEFDVYPNFPSDNEYRLYDQDKRDRDITKISDSEYEDGTAFIYNRWYTSNVIYWLERDQNNEHKLGDAPADFGPLDFRLPSNERN